MSNEAISSPEYLASRLRGIEGHMQSFEALLADLRGVKARLGALESEFQNKLEKGALRLQQFEDRHRELMELVESGTASATALAGTRDVLEREIAAARSAVESIPASVESLRAEVTSALESGLAENVAAVTRALTAERRAAEQREQTFASTVRSQLAESQNAYEGLSQRVQAAERRTEVQFGEMRVVSSRGLSDERGKRDALGAVLAQEQAARSSSDRRWLIWLVLLTVAEVGIAVIALSRAGR